MANLNIINQYPIPDSILAPKSSMIKLELKSGEINIDPTETIIYADINADPTTIIYDFASSFLGDWTTSQLYELEPNNHLFVLKNDNLFNYEDKISLKTTSQLIGIPPPIDFTWNFFIKNNPYWDPNPSNMSNFELFCQYPVFFKYLEQLRLLLLEQLVPQGNIYEKIRRIFQTSYLYGLPSYLIELDADWDAIKTQKPVENAWQLNTVWKETEEKLTVLTDQVILELQTMYDKNYLSELIDAFKQGKTSDKLIGLSCTTLILGIYYIYINE